MNKAIITGWGLRSSTSVYTLVQEKNNLSRGNQLGCPIKENWAIR